MEIDAVQDHIEQVGIRFDLRVLRRLHRVLDGEGMQAEEVAEQRGVGGVWLADVSPDPYAAARFQPCAIDVVQAFSPTAAMNVVRNQSPTFTCNAACAAASRATGIRYGEALT